MEFIEAYFDESGSHDGSPVLCVAGYVFESAACKALDLKWKDVLFRYKDLPYFHMVDCAHGAEPFDRLTDEECIECEKEMIALIREHMLFGSAVAIEESYYNSIDLKNNAGSAYSFCCWQSLMAVRAWADQNNFDGKIAYFFESGHASQSEANNLMNRIFRSPHLRAQYRYNSHIFVDKACNRPIQTADILAWLFATQHKRRQRGLLNFRLDLRALVKDNDHRLLHLKPPRMAELEEYVASQIRPPGGLSGRFGPWRF